MKYDRFMITFSADGLPDVVVMHDETPVGVSGYGGWTTVARQRRISLTQWAGKDPITMSLPILFDGYATGDGQEIAIATLSRMALPSTSGDEPPAINISGNGVPAPGPKLWVIADIQWGQNIIWDANQRGVTSRMRQDAVVNVMQYVADDRVAFKNIKLASGTKGSKLGWPKKYTTVTGDNLQKIAAKFYKNSTKWKKIADANGIRDGKNLKRGTVLIIPAP